MPSLHTWNIKIFVLFCLFFILIIALSYINQYILDVINNLYWKQDDWVAAVYDNEWYPGTVAEVSWILAYIIDKLSCFE